MAFITVTDAAGRVLFRRPAIAAEIDEAKRAAAEAESDAYDALGELARRRAVAGAAGALSGPQAEPEPQAQTLENAPATGATFDAFDEFARETPEPFATAAAPTDEGAPRGAELPLFDEEELARLLGEPGSRPVERLRMPGSPP